MKKLLINFLFLNLFLLSVRASSAAEGYLIDRLNHCKIYTAETTNRYATWTGPCSNGFANGRGITKVYENDKLIFTDEVTRMNGKEEGFGKLIWPDGTIYVGQMSDNKYNGQGKLTYSEEVTRISMQKLGEGALISEGEFLNDSLKNGTMTTVDANGTKYLIHVKDGKGIKRETIEEFNRTDELENSLKELNQARDALNRMFGEAYQKTDKIRKALGCDRYYAARQQCAVAGDFEKCMQILVPNYVRYHLLVSDMALFSFSKLSNILNREFSRVI